MSNKIYTFRELVEMYDNFSCKKKVQILELALEEMSVYNSRSKMSCKIIAMEFQPSEDEKGYIKNS